MSEKQIKVTDRRMFTADGRLREEYQHLDSANDSPAAPAPVETSVAPSPAPEVEPEPTRRQDAEERPSQDAPLSRHPPTMFELISLIGEPAAVYLQQSRIPDGQSAEHLELARLHIDLLALVKQKTAGNLSPREEMALDDALHQLRGLYLENRG